MNTDLALFNYEITFVFIVMAHYVVRYAYKPHRPRSFDYTFSPQSILFSKGLEDVEYTKRIYLSFCPLNRKSWG